MRRSLLASLVVLASFASLAAAPRAPLLDFRHDLAFQPEAIDAFAALVYKQRLADLRAHGRRVVAEAPGLDDGVVRLDVEIRVRRAGVKSARAHGHADEGSGLGGMDVFERFAARRRAGGLEIYHLPVGTLTLEITESHLMSDPTRTLPLLRRLAELGVRLPEEAFSEAETPRDLLRYLVSAPGAAQSAPAPIPAPLPGEAVEPAPLSVRTLVEAFGATGGVGGMILALAVAFAVFVRGSAPRRPSRRRAPT